MRLGKPSTLTFQNFHSSPLCLAIEPWAEAFTVDPDEVVYLHYDMELDADWTPTIEFCVWDDLQPKYFPVRKPRPDRVVLG